VVESRWAIFRNRDFILYWLGFLLSLIGDAIFSITLSWLVVEATGSGVIMGSILMAMGLPRIVLMLLGGVMTDRMDARRVMIISDLLRAGVMGGLMVLAWGGRPPVWSLYAVALTFGAVDAFYWPAANALRQRLIPPGQLSQANGIITGSMQASVIVGPPLGAVLLKVGGYSLNLFLNGLSFLVSAATLFALSLPAREAPAASVRRSIWQDLYSGIRYVWKTPIILTLIVTTFVANIGANGVGVGLPFLADEMGVGVEGMGQMTSGYGIGGVLGALVFSLWVNRRPSLVLVVLAFLVQGLAFSLVGLAGGTWQVALLLAIVGIAATTVMVNFNSIVQSLVPPDLIGRVSSVSALISMGSTPIAQATAGWLMDQLGPRLLYIGGGLLEVVAALVALTRPAIRNYEKEAQPVSYRTQPLP
jgi:DHA3 family macrolide efflux protein-like MFS transporter